MIDKKSPTSQSVVNWWWVGRGGGGGVVEEGLWGGGLSFELCAQLGRHAGSVEAVDSVQPHFLFQSRSLKTVWFSGGGQ